VALPEGVEFESGALRINGRSVTLERGQNNRFFVPLVDANPDDSISLVELRYTVPGNGSRLDLPSFPEDPAVQKVFLCVYLPQERVLLQEGGRWTAEFDWSLGQGGRWRPVARTADGTDKPLIQWLVEGKPSSLSSQAGVFPTDGQLHVFSTVRPADPPDGSLRLATAHESTLALVVLGSVLIVGLLLAPARIAARVFFLGLLVIAMIACGLFWPIAARQIIDMRLAGSLAAVFALWGIVWSIRLCPCTKSCKQVSAETPPSTTPPAENPSAASPVETEHKEGGADHA
jgi:hypothetical protein